MEKRICPTCNQYVGILNVNFHQAYEEQTLECGHTGKRIVLPTINEPQIVSGEKLEANVIKLKTPNDIPVYVSGASEISYFTSGNIQLSIDKNTGVIYAGTWNTTNIYNYQQIDSRSAISNFKDILIQVDSNNTYSSEEKEMIKGNLAKINDIIISTGATGVKLMPWIQLLGSLFH